MPAATATFKQCDLERAFRAALKVGVPVRVEIEPGKMVVTTLDRAESADGDHNPCDELLK